MYHRRLIIHLIYLSLSSLLFMMDHHIALGDLTNDQTTCTIAVLDSSRSIMPSWAFLSGSEFSTARELLNNHEYFGPDGIIHQSFQIMEINSISNQSLAGIELFIFSPAGWVTGISAEEVAAVERYVQNGGCLLEIRDNSGRPSLLGLSAAGQVSDPYAVLTESAADTPIINGPFGVVTSPIRTGYNGYFNYDPEQVMPLASNVAGPMMFMVSAATGANGSSLDRVGKPGDAVPQAPWDLSHWSPRRG